MSHVELLESFIEHSKILKEHRKKLIEQRAKQEQEAQKAREEEQREAERQRQIDEVKKRPDCEDLIDMYYRSYGKDYHDRADDDVIWDLLHDYDGLSEDGIMELQRHCEERKQWEAELMKHDELENKISSYTLDDFAQMDGYEEFTELLEKHLDLQGHDFDDEAILRNCKTVFLQCKCETLREGIEYLKKAYTQLVNETTLPFE